MEKIQGYLKSYIYKNDENGYVIAKLETDQQELITIVGYLPLISEDVLYAFEGQLIEHPRYGKQFKVENYQRIETQTKSGLIRYLSSDDFYGIGPKTAEKIVDLLGETAINQILENEKVLAPILNPIKRTNLKKTLLQKEVENNIFVSLFDLGLSQKIAAKLFKAYGKDTLEKLNEDPFRLMYEIEGFGFIKSSMVAEKMGVEKDDIRTIKAAIIYTLEHAAYGEGDLYLSLNELDMKVKKIIQLDISIDEALKELIEEGKVILEADKYFLKEIYLTEKEIAVTLNNHLNQAPFDLDSELLELLLTQIELQKSINYTDKQKEAILSAINHPMTIITGGPGTGKTTLIDGLLTLYATYYKLNLKSQNAKESIALMAPTGRAAKRMKELLHFEARTIHSHLGFNFEQKFKTIFKEVLPQKLIIIDEASMIDIFLARRLFESIALGAQVIIVGDEDQLPSVGPGNVLGDLIASHQIPVIRLNEIHRQAKDSHIIKLANHVNRQKLTDDDFLSHQDVIFYRGDYQDIKRVILNQIDGAIKKGYSLIEDIQVLIPLYKGDIGIDAMNQRIQKQFNPNYGKGLKMSYGDKTYFKGDKVIQLQNDNERHIMNGDIGVIESIMKKEDSEQLIMQIAFDEETVYYEQSDLENINLAYVISIHKSQGSEYKIVFLPIIKSYLHMLKKELIYTAITRAKEYLLLLGDMNLLKYAANQLSEKRKTMLKHRLIENKTNQEETEDVSPYDFM